MLDAVVLKGTGMVLMREDWNGYGTAGCRRYRVSRVLLHSTTPVSLDWHGCVYVWAACLQAGQWGNRLLSTLGREIWKCLERRRGEEGGKQSRTEGLSGLSRGEWGAWRRVERDWGTEKKKTPSISLQVCTATGHSIYCWYMCSIYVSSCTSTCNFASAHRGF